MSEGGVCLRVACVACVHSVRLVCGVDERNTASCRVVEKSHYRFVRSVIETPQADRPALAVRCYERLSVLHTVQLA